MVSFLFSSWRPNSFSKKFHPCHSCCLHFMSLSLCCLHFCCIRGVLFSFFALALVWHERLSWLSWADFGTHECIPNASILVFSKSERLSPIIWIVGTIAVRGSGMCISFHFSKRIARHCRLVQSQIVSFGWISLCREARVMICVNMKMRWFARRRL